MGCDRRIGENCFEAEIIWIPVEPGDPLGHSDGIVRFVDKNTVFINDYSSIFEKDKRFRKYEEKLIKALEKHNHRLPQISLCYGSWDWNMTEKQWRKSFPDGDLFSPGFGFTRLSGRGRDDSCLPAMGLPEDKEARERLKYDVS